MGDKGNILMVFQAASVFYLRSKPDQSEGNVIPGGRVGARAYAIQRLQTFKNLLHGLSSSLVHEL